MSPIALPMQELKPALTGLGKVMSRHSSLPVLNHIKVERTKEGWIALTASDLESFATVRLEQPVDGEPVSMLVPYDELQKITKSCSRNDTVSIQTGENPSAASEIIISYPVGQQSVETKVATLPVEEFPEVPRITGDSIPVPETLRSSLRDALDCSSTDSTRYILNGAYIDVSDPKGHYVVGTDGRHLFASNSFSLPLKSSIILPSHRFLDWKEFNADGEWKLKASDVADKDLHLQLTSRRWRFITRQHEGNYPNWRQVIPSNSQYNTGLTFGADTVDTVIKTAERMPDHDEKDHAIVIELKGKKVHLCCKANREAPWTPVEIKYVKTEGADVRIALNRQLLIKALRFGLNRLEMIDPMSPMRFSNGGRQMIVMPLRADVTNPEPEAKVSSSASPSPAAPTPKAAEPERSPMPRQTATPPAGPASNGNGNGNGSTTATADEKEANATLEAQIDQCLDDIDTLKEYQQLQATTFASLRAKLKTIQREHKASSKDLQAVRQTLRTLQGVKL